MPSGDSVSAGMKASLPDGVTMRSRGSAESGAHIVEYHADEIHAELFHEFGIRLGRFARLDAVTYRIAPFDRVGFGGFHHLDKFVLIEIRGGRERRPYFGGRRPGRRSARPRSRRESPSRSRLEHPALMAAARLSMPDFFSSAPLPLSRSQKNPCGHDQCGKGIAVLPLGDVGELLAESFKTRIVNRRGQVYGNFLVWLGWRRFLQLLLCHGRAA